MDARVTLPSTSKQELSVDSSMDIISNLPEPVLSHVLSFLSTKEVIQTSVLSRRWQDLWTIVPSIDLEDESVLEVSQSNFAIFVTRVVSLHDSSKIKRIRLRLHLPAMYPWLHSSISYVLKNNVEDLDLFFGSKQQYEFSCRLFTCPSLVVLKISALVTFKPPSSTNFANLKKLHLSLVLFSDDVSIQRLFSNCPVLEKLALKNCEWKHIQSVAISIPTLKSLSIEVHNEAVLDCLINIFSSNITYLYCSTDFSVNLCICDLPSLDRAYVEIPCPEKVMDGIAYRAQRIFSSIYNVKSLRISHDVLLSIMELENLWHNIPIFHNLTHLELGSETFPQYILLMKFLQKTPNLENLNVFESFEDDSFGPEEYEDDSFGPEEYEDELPHLKEDSEIEVPSCFSSSLKIFSISYFEGQPEEMKLASFVLRNAIILQRMIVRCFRTLSEDENKRVLLKNKLNKLKVSKSCVIELHKDSHQLL